MNTSSKLTREGRSAFRMGVFATAAVAAVAVIFALQLVPPRGDVFDGNGERLAALDTLSTLDVAELKFNHARENPRYRVGLFGNSRALNVSAESVGLRSSEFFNFALSGSSIRQSVAFLEELQRLGAAPRVAVVSLDHLELQLYANPVYPPLPARWMRVLDDVGLALTARDISARDRARIVWRHAFNEWSQFVEQFNAERLRYRVALFLRRPTSVAALTYRADGSRSEPVAASVDAPKIQAAERRMFIPAMFDDDLARLGHLQNAGIRVIVYESPLESRSAAHFQREPSSHVAVLRAEMIERCRALALECYPAQILSGDATLWRDPNHAPAALLGPYIASLIAEPAPRIGRAE